MSLRLTLRTLLAYLDDTLEPAKAREIGQKIAESDQARELTERIKTVMRRRRLIANAADPDSTDLDANDVAEYIDNVLDPERVGKLEQACIESDMDLAEVASVHQILTLVLGEPADFSDEGKERIYGLVGDKKTKHPPRSTIGPKTHKAKPVERHALLDSQAIPLSVPPYVDGLAPTRKVGSIVSVGILAAALVVIIWLMVAPRGKPPEGLAKMDHALAKVEEKAKVSEPAPKAEPAPAEPAVAEPVPVTKTEESKDLAETASSPPEEKPGKSASAPEEKAEPEPAPATPTPTAPPPPPPPSPSAAPAEADDASDGTEAAVAGTKREEMKDEPGSTAEPTESETAPAPAPAAPGEVATIKGTPDKKPAAKTGEDKPLTPDLGGLVPLATFVSPKGLLLKRTGERLARVDPNGFLFATDEIINLDGYRSTLELGSKDTIELVDQTRITPRDAPSGEVSFDLREGRFVFRLAGKQSTLRLRVGPRETTVKVSGERATVGFAVVWFDPPSWGNEARVPIQSLEAHVVRGEVDFEAGQASQRVGGGNELRYAGKTGTVEVLPADVAPAWVTATLGKVEEMVGQKLADRIPAADRIVLSLREEASSAEPSVRRLAVLGLGAVADVEGLVLTIVRPKNADARELAIGALRQVVWQDPQRVPEARSAFVKAIGPKDADIATGLVLGYSDAAREERKTYEDLINWLESEQPTLRELAIYNLVRLTDGKTYNYSAEASPTRRRGAVLQWRRWLENEKPTTPKRPREGTTK